MIHGRFTFELLLDSATIGNRGYRRVKGVIVWPMTNRRIDNQCVQVAIYVNWWIYKKEVSRKELWGKKNQQNHNNNMKWFHFISVWNCLFLFCHKGNNSKIWKTFTNILVVFIDCKGCLANSINVLLSVIRFSVQNSPILIASLVLKPYNIQYIQYNIQHTIYHWTTLLKLI